MNLYGSQLSKSNIKASNAYGWSYQFEENSLGNLVIKYFGVLHIGARIRAKILEKVLSEDFSNKNLLDAGSGIGLTSFFLAERFNEVLAVDIDKAKIAQAKVIAKDNKIKNVNFKAVDLLKDNFTRDKFAVVTCFEVIEHVKSAQDLINTLAKRLDKNGKIILSFPSNSFISALAQKSLDHEVVGFLPKDIKRMAAINKVKVTKQMSFGNTIFAQWIIALDFFIRKTVPVVSPLLFPIFYPLIVLDLNMPVMGVPRGYVLVLERNK